MKTAAKGKTKPRVRAVPRHRSFRLSKKKLTQHQPLPSVYVLLKQTVRVIRSRKRLFIGIALINALISFVFVQGLGSSFDLVQLKKNLESALGGSSGQLSNGIALFSYLLSSAGSSASDSSGSYQLILTIVTSLAVIWAVRQVQAGELPRIRDSFYKGMYPLIPFSLLLIVIGLQFLPLIIGNLVFATVLQNGLASTMLEKVLWFILFILLGLLSLYMIASSLFSLYIATLPDMAPLKALRSARELVLHRRAKVMIRIIALPLILLLAYMLIFIPLIIFLTPATEPIFLVFTSFIMVVFHVYMYMLYRALI